MTKQITLILLFFVTFSLAGGKDKPKLTYPVSSIPEKLKKDAFAVSRKFSDEFELIDYGKATEKINIVITVLEENGDHFAELVVPYDKSIKITGISGQYYNEDGTPGEKLKNSDIQDVNYNSGAIYDDIRMKVAEFKIKEYPYTVEYQIQLEHNGIRGYPEFSPLDNYRFSVEESNYKFTWPANLAIRFREFNLPGGCRKELAENGKKIMEWNIDSLEAIKEEPFSPNLTTINPRVVTGPTRFIYDGSAGDMSTWKIFGDWINGLNAGLDQLPENRKLEIRQMVGEVRDTFQTISMLYKYMQKRTRYVGIQLGIGGYKPFPAETVDRLGYGDCKALSNYMKALLNCVGIPSVYIIIGAGPNKGITMPDFPTVGQNNHAILCVPTKNDTIWLECTSQSLPTGYTSLFTAGRTALLITNEGGKLKPVPYLDKDKSFKKRKTLVTLTPEKSVLTEMRTIYSGYQYDNIDEILEKGKQDQEKNILERLGIPGIKVQSISITEQPTRIPVVTETINFSSDLLITKTGTRLFVPLNFMLSRPKSLQKNENRKMPVFQNVSTFETDSTIVQFPIGYQIEGMPKDKKVSSPFGEYTAKTIPGENQLLLIRELKINKGEWPKEKFPELVDFYTAIASNDKTNLVLKEKQP